MTNRGESISVPGPRCLYRQRPSSTEAGRTPDVAAATEGTVEKHVRSILTKLDLYEAEDDHRRVLAVIAFLEADGSSAS